MSGNNVRLKRQINKLVVRDEVVSLAKQKHDKLFFSSKIGIISIVSCAIVRAEDRNFDRNFDRNSTAIPIWLTNPLHLL